MTTTGLYVDKATAQRAIALVAPMIEAARSNVRIVGSGFLYLVVLDPCAVPGEVSFAQAILHEQGFGDEARWDADYRRFARDKAQLAWRHGMDAHRVQTLAPQLLEAGDTLLWGSICLDGIVVGASGAFPWYDELFAGAVACALRALAKEARSSAAS